MRYPLNRPRVRVGFAFGDPWFNTGKRHTGEDDHAVAGEPVYAPADGVLYNHTVDPKWGNGIVLDCGGWGCSIWHVDHLLPDGSHVTEGQQIATIYDLQGNTHMHLSFWVGQYDEDLRAGALFPAVFPDRFVEPDEFLDTHPTHQTGGFLMALTDEEQAQVYNWLKDGISGGTWSALAPGLNRAQQQDLYNWVRFGVSGPVNAAVTDQLNQIKATLQQIAQSPTQAAAAGGQDPRISEVLAILQRLEAAFKTA